MQYFRQDSDNVQKNMVTIVGEMSMVYNSIENLKKVVVANYITTSDVKAYSHIDESDDDTKITMVIQAACDMLEEFSAVGFRSLTVTASIINGLGNIKLPYTVRGDVTEVGGDVLDLKETFTEAKNITYSAGVTTTIPDNLKVIALMQIDFILKGGSGLDQNVKMLLRSYN